MVPHGYSAYGARDNRSEREFGPLHRSGHISLHDCRDVSGNGGDQSRYGGGSASAFVFRAPEEGMRVEVLPFASRESRIRKTIRVVLNVIPA